LTNPAFARRQVLGVYSERLVETVARVLAALGAEHALVVHSRDGLDEISVSAATHVCEVRGGEVRSYDLEPEDLGVGRHPIEAVAGGDAQQNAAIAREILGGSNGANAARRDVVLANAGAALFVGGLAPTLRDGVELARESLAGGRAAEKLEDLVRESNAAGGIS
ncbi:MAG TPA: anthranilate phosphoribosyltransferase, partial [Thermoanaerobaculia bacterium]|nr:anthranilate phosphoribosyltransferase [Thermoanaerobaculia bacterium]